MRYTFEYPEEYRVNHTFTISLPSIDSLEDENLTLENNGEFEIYTKCMDANGNENVNDFVFKFCVQKGPDTQVPYAVGSNIGNGMPVPSGQESFDFELYVNEPAECKWSHEDREYDNMENQMDCNEEYDEYNNQMIWICYTTLTGIKDKQENKFYFRCTDSEMNVNSQDLFYEDGGFIIMGTQPLVIDDAGPNGTIRDSTIAVKTTLTAKTSAGYKEGEAICSYSEVGEELFIEFFNTNSYTHSTDLFLPEGDYEYIIKCVDLGGNEDTWEVSFSTESDSEPPEVVRAYKQENFLKVITDEVAECVYDTKSCSYLFEDGLPMTDDEESHFTDWDIKKKFYIKCRDEYGNEPDPDECSIIVRLIE